MYRPSMYRTVRGTCALLARYEYDKLVKKYPSWMEKVWPRIVKRWHLFGPAYDDSYYCRIVFLLSKI